MTRTWPAWSSPVRPVSQAYALCGRKRWSQSLERTFSSPAGTISRSPGNRAESRARRAGVTAWPGTRVESGSGVAAQLPAMNRDNSGDTGRS